MPKTWPLNGSGIGWRRPSAYRTPRGHWHLYCLLTVHAALTRDGVAAAAGVLTRKQIVDAITACGYFDLPDLATSLTRIARAAATPGEAHLFDDDYHRRYVAAGTLVAAIRRTMADRPSDFPAAQD